VVKEDREGIPIFEPNLQVSFYVRLQTFRHSHLSEALGTTIKSLDISEVDKELGLYVESGDLAKLASFGLRGEIVFPVPYVLRTRPSLLGYYRLLYGLSQKEFYRNRVMNGFKRLEDRNEMVDGPGSGLEALCRSLSATGGLLLAAVDELDLRTVRDLQLLTLGAQLRGGQNTKVGKDAAAEVFSIIQKLVEGSVVEEGAKKLVVKNAAGREVIVTFSSDPDIAVSVAMTSEVRPLVSIEIKGGTDISNVHNRIGEAEKSHQKAKSRGFFEFWTIVGAEIDLETAQRESPTTTRFFYLRQLRIPTSAEYDSFRDHFQSVVGIKAA